MFRKMQKVITRKVLDHLDSIAKESVDTYQKFYQEFGSVLREGIHSDFDHQDRIARLLRFGSTQAESQGKLISLEDYCGRMAEGQEQIYFITSTDPNSVLRDPNLEIFRSRDLRCSFSPTRWMNTCCRVWENSTRRKLSLSILPI